MPPEPSARFPGAGMSRRRLLGLSAAAGVPLIAGLGVASPGGATPPAGSTDAVYRAWFRACVDADPDVRRSTTAGDEFWYRPRQLLVAPADLARVSAWLVAHGFVAAAGAGFGGVERLQFTVDVDIRDIVTRLRDPGTWPGMTVPAVQPHHVTFGYPNIMGSPGGPPQAAAPVAGPDPADALRGRGVRVGVCDTGMWAHAATAHPEWFGGRYTADKADTDRVYTYGSVLAPQGGHGTFVAGVLMRAAPGVGFDPRRALNEVGVGDEEMLVRAIEQVRTLTPVITMSLGCHTQGNRPPLPIAHALAGLPASSVAVAAAGNAAASRPAWPAAFPSVVGVAAVDRETGGAGGYVPAGYSNFGPWVDACASGRRTSLYVPGRLLLPGEEPEVFTGSATWAGTSFAAPHVAGTLAAMMSRDRTTAQEARQELLGGPRWHDLYGVLVP